jgi:glycosyltransferase involved in cell wall biosynthesis
MPDPGPVAVGGVSGSGTRLVAAILRDAGVYLGADLNEALDNLWFTLLLKRPRWLPDRLWSDDPELLGPLSVLEKAMTGRLGPTPAERGYIEAARDELVAYGHNNRGDGRGEWAEERARSLLRSAERGGRPVRWGWKEPATMLLADQLFRYFEDVRYVHVIRNPLDMAFRADQQDLHTWGRVFGFEPPYEPGPSLPLKYWLAANERVLEQGTMLLEDRFLVLRYEELCRDPRGGVEGLLSFAGVEAPDALDRLAALARPSPSIEMYRDRDLSLFDRPDLDRVREFGYEVTGVARPRGTPRVRLPADGLRLSVALCTYQGERFLADQLGSIAAQTRAPDEMVVRDDGSTDGTMDLLHRFASAVRFPVRLDVNPERLGSTKNFEQAIARCQGDVIFLSDQDDLWHRRKLERVAGVLAEEPQVAGVFTDGDLIDERSRPIGRGLWQSLGFEGSFRRQFADGEAVSLLVTRGNVVTGTAMGFRSSYRDLILPIPEAWVQDAWIAILLSAVAEMRLLPEQLIRYRLHPGQQIGVPDPASAPPPQVLTRLDHLVRWTQLPRRMRKNEREMMRGFGSYFAPVIDRLRERDDRFPPTVDVFPVIEGMVAHMRARGQMEQEPHRWRAVLRELGSGRYHRYSNGMSSAMKDLLLLDRAGGRGRT